VYKEANKLLTRGAKLEDYVSPCNYLKDQTSTMEGMLIHLVDDRMLEYLLESGYRHFGYHYFRPLCRDCHQCIPIRIGLENYRFPRSAKRLFKRNAGFSVKLERPRPSQEAHSLYLKHSRRFDDRACQSFEEFSLSFFYPSPWAYQLSVRAGDRLIAVSHLDITANMTSAIYNYFDDAYEAASPGTFLIFKTVEMALRLKQHHVYLGYYVPGNRHMNYKTRFRPNQLLLREGEWIDYMDPKGTILPPPPPHHGFHPHPLQSSQ
jgi:arginyl-tRNA--protein-N-Asp/Glu arginylyltransferase